MNIDLKYIKNPLTHSSDCLVVDVRDKSTIQVLNQTSKGLVKKIIQSGEIERSHGRCLLLPFSIGIKAKQILLTHFTDSNSIDSATFNQRLGSLLDIIFKIKARKITIMLPSIKVKNHNDLWKISTLVSKAEALDYRYTETKKAPSQKTQKKLSIGTTFTLTSAHKQALNEGVAIALGVKKARHVADLPPNICTPNYLAEQARELSQGNDNLSVEILDEEAMHELGMGALLSVSSGSKEEAQLITLHYQGANKDMPPYALVGKGITFDTGGISLKPSASMDEMKFDMCGAASVLGTMAAITHLQLPINVLGVIASAENMPGQNATRPGDVVTTMSGKTVEILNTDAEGRLVLCDALSYIQRRKPQLIIDVATLTGACLIALGRDPSALFCNNDALATRLEKAAVNSGDAIWRMPLWAPYHKQLKSNFADLANIGGREAGSITAACFLEQFIEDNCPWAHLDIAGTAWRTGKSKGATGRPVPLLCNFLIAEASKL